MNDKARLFAREATGLVREVSLLDAVIFNSSNAPVGFVLAYSVVLGFLFYKGNVLLGIGLAILGSIPVVYSYVILTSAAPRSGGDYVFVSRILHPAIGFAANFGLVIWQIIGAGSIAVMFAQLGISPALSVLGVLTGNSTLMEWGGRFAGPPWDFIAAVAIILLLGALLIRGTQETLRFNDVVWGVGMLSLLLIFAILLPTSNAEFVQRFNSLAGSDMGPNAYQGLIDLANLQARNPLLMLWGMLAIGMFGSGWFFWSTYISGEVKGASNFGRQLQMMFWPVIVNGGVFLIGTGLFIKTFGYDFIAAVTKLSFENPDVLPFAGLASNVTMLSGISTTILPLAAAAVLLYIMWAWPLLPCYTVFCIRAVFAWSFDRIFPTRLSEVSARYNTPVLLTVIVCVLVIGVAAITSFTPYIWYIFAATFIGTALNSMLVACISCALLPTRMKELYEGSPASRQKPFGVPLATLTGVVGALFTILWCAAYVYFPEFGMWENSGVLGGLLVGVPILGAVIFYISKAIRKRQGIDLDLVFKEIPPE